MKLYFWTCTKCKAPMECTMKSRDYWMCRFCGHEQDGWYPDEESEKIIVGWGSETKYKEYTVYRNTDLDYVRILVESDTIEAKYLSGRRHHFDSQEVKNVLAGK